MDSSHKHGPTCSCAGFELGSEDDNLWEVIDHDNIQCLNEEKRDSCKKIFRCENDKFNFTEFLQSPEDDPELIIIIPFKEEVKIRCLQMIYSSTATTLPEQANCFKNIENVSFDLIDDDPTQAVPLKYVSLSNGELISEGTINIKIFINV